MIAVIGMTLNETDVLKVYASAVDMSLNLFGVEFNQGNFEWGQGEILRGEKRNYKALVDFIDEVIERDRQKKAEARKKTYGKISVGGRR